MEVACIYTGHLDWASYAYFITHVILLFAIVIAQSLCDEHSDANAVVYNNNIVHCTHSPSP